MRLGKMVVRSVENATKIRADIKTRAYSAEVQRTFMLMYVLFIVVIQCPFPQFADGFPQFADGLGNSVQTLGLLQVLLNLVDLNMQAVQRC